MPCYTIRTVTFELKGANQDVLVRGLKAAGFRIGLVDRENVVAYSKQGIPLRIFGGKIEVQEGYGHVAQQVNKAYATEAVKTAAQKYGFKVTQDARQPQRLTLNRRAF